MIKDAVIFWIEIKDVNCKDITNCQTLKPLYLFADLPSAV